MEAYELTFRNFGYLLRISWAWLALMVALSIAFYAFIFPWRKASYVQSVFRDVSLLLLFGPYFASISVAWHRRFLANEVWPRLVYIRLDRLVVSYFSLSVIISFLLYGPMYMLPDTSPENNFQVFVFFIFGSSWSRVGNFCLDNARKLCIS
jgi:hypothetical protein